MAEAGQHGEREAKAAHPDSAASFRIFLNYRREDAAVHVGRLWDALRFGVEGHPGFGDDQIFIDIDTIEPGVDFREAIRKAVEASDVFLAVIGRQWLGAVDSKGRRRLDDPADFVRIEIEAALERAAQHHDVRVVPTRVQGADMPGVEDLPETLAHLAHRNAVELTDERWHYDVGRLLASLKKLEREKIERAGREREAAEVAPLEGEAIGRPTREQAREPAEPAERAREPLVRDTTEEERQREKERRERLLKAGVGAAIAVALAAGAALLIGFLGNGEERSDGTTPPKPRAGALVWQRSGGPDLGGEGDQAMTSIIGTSRGGLAYIAGGYDGPSGSRDAAIWTSEDGRAWQRIPAEEDFEATGDQTVRSVADFGGALVAVGTDDSAGDIDVGLARSSDGIHWDAAALRVPGSDEVINRVTNTRIGPGRVLVGAGWQTGDGDEAAVWLFPAGEAIPDADVDPVSAPDFRGPGDQRITRVVQLGPGEGRRLVAVGLADGDAGVWVSEDGQAWERVDVAALRGDGDQEMLDATVFESKVVAVGRDGASGAAWLSEDGRSWTRVPDREGTLARSGPVSLNRVRPTELESIGVPGLVAGGSAGGDAAVWTSTDGLEWAREADPARDFGGAGEQTIHSLTGHELGVIAVGSSGPKNGLDAAVWVGARPG